MRINSIFVVRMPYCSQPATRKTVSNAKGKHMFMFFARYLSEIPAF